MSIFGNIVSAIFKHGTAAATTAGPSASAAKGAASGAPGITGKAAHAGSSRRHDQENRRRAG